MKTASMKTVQLPSGDRVSAFGMGTWKMGEDTSTHADELETLREGIDMGATLIDTAEMYGGGMAEKLVGEAIAERRNQVFLVTKVLPQNASRRRMATACEASLRRLGTDRIDLYLLHWRGDVPLAETMEAFMALQSAGKIRHYGVSNFDVSDMRELWTVRGGTDVATNQLLYNLSRRGIEWELLPLLRERHIPVMAYSPIEESRLLLNPKLIDFAARNGMTPAQVALAWLLAKDDVIVIPKTSHLKRFEENFAALEHNLAKPQLAELDSILPPPTGPRPLEMI